MWLVRNSDWVTCEWTIGILTRRCKGWHFNLNGVLEILDFCSEEFGESGAKGVIFIDGPSLVTVRSVQKLLGHFPHFTAVCTLRKLPLMILLARFVKQLHRKSTGATIFAVSLPDTFQATTLAFSVSSLLGEPLSRRLIIWRRAFDLEGFWAGAFDRIPRLSPRKAKLNILWIADRVGVFPCNIILRELIVIFNRNIGNTEKIPSIRRVVRSKQWIELSIASKRSKENDRTSWRKLNSWFIARLRKRLIRA